MEIDQNGNFVKKKSHKKRSKKEDKVDDDVEMSDNVNDAETKKKKDKKKKHKRRKSKYNMIDVNKEELEHQLQVNFQLKTFKKLVEEKMD